VSAGPTVPPTVPPRGGSWPDRRHLGDRYRLDEVIASGGAAIVWRGFDEHLARPVAVKLLHPHHAGDPTVVERFQREARAAAGLSHPNVVRIYDVGRDDGITWLVMELVEGPSVRDVLLAREPLDPSVVAALGEQVARALGAAHERGLVHRDIKPANLLIASDGTVKVTDFGIAKALSGVDETLTSTGTVMGTAAYVAPEQLETTDIDARADVYALGVVLYEALIGRPAFSGDTPAATAAMRLTHELLPPSRSRSDVPEELDEIVVRATRRDRGQRYADGHAFAAALTPLLSRRPSLLTARLLPGAMTAAPTDVEPLDAGTGALARPGELRRLLGAALAGAALTAAAGLALLVLRGTPEPASPGAAPTWTVAEVRALDTTGTLGEDVLTAATAAVDADVQTAWLAGPFATEDLTVLGGDGTPGGGADGDAEVPAGGVGLLLDLGEPRQVRGLVLRLARGGADVTVRHGDEPPGPDDDPATWGTARTVQVGVRSVQRVEFTPVEARWWLVWVTRATLTPGGTFTLEVADVTVLAPG